MNNIPTASKKLATTSLTMGILGWAFYILQWCFDLTVGLLLAAVTGGSSALCSTVLDFLPFVLWMIGIVTGHVALGQMKRSPGPGRGRAIWGLILNYSGVFFLVLFIVVIVVLIATGVGVGVLDKIIPFFQKH
jgi:hypothetical protein